MEIRKEVLIKLKKFEENKSEKEEQTIEILSKLLKEEVFIKSKVIALYMPQSFEFDLTLLFDNIKEKKILIPKVMEQKKMIFTAFDEKNLIRSKFGILETISSKEEYPDFILVPGLAWNAENYRIGFGGGYYDRYLKNFKGETMSLCYHFQKLDFEPEAHDVKIKEVIHALSRTKLQS